MLRSVPSSRCKRKKKKKKTDTQKAPLIYSDRSCEWSGEQKIKPKMRKVQVSCQVMSGLLFFSHFVEQNVTVSFWTELEKFEELSETLWAEGNAVSWTRPGGTPDPQTQDTVYFRYKASRE